MSHTPDHVVRLLSAAGSGQDATLVKGERGRLYKIIGYNVAAATRYLKVYNKATVPVVGTDTPVWTLPLPAGTVFAFDLDGHEFSLGIGFGLVTAGADNSTASVTAGDIVGLNVSYS